MKTFKEIREGAIGDFLAKRKKQNAVKADLKRQHDFHQGEMKYHNDASSKANKQGDEDRADMHNGKAHDHEVARDHLANALAAHNKGNHNARNDHMTAWKNHSTKARIPISKG